MCSTATPSGPTRLPDCCRIHPYQQGLLAPSSSSGSYRSSLWPGPAGATSSSGKPQKGCTGPPSGCIWAKRPVADPSSTTLICPTTCWPWVYIWLQRHISWCGWPSIFGTLPRIHYARMARTIPHGGRFDGARDWLRLDAFRPSRSVLPWRPRATVETTDPKASQRTEVNSDG